MAEPSRFDDTRNRCACGDVELDDDDQELVVVVGLVSHGWIACLR